MAEGKTKEPSYIGEVLRFYFAPELRSIVTILFFGAYCYLALYHVGGLLLAARFVLYTVTGHTVLQSTGHLFTGMIFTAALVLPSVLSIYSIFVIHRIWQSPNWATYMKAIVAIVVALGTMAIILGCDAGARIAAREGSMQSFIEDANLTDRI